MASVPAPFFSDNYDDYASDDESGYDSDSSDFEVVTCPILQAQRLQPAAALTGANIPCLVWADDVLNFAHSLPAPLTQSLQLIPLSLSPPRPFERMPNPPNWWLEPEFEGPAPPSCFPYSLPLRNTTPEHEPLGLQPDQIFLHPQSFFSLDVSDHSRSTTLTAANLPPAYAAIRFPTRTAFLDALLDALTDPQSGVRTLQDSLQLSEYAAYLRLGLPYPPVLPNGDLQSEHAALRDGLRPENRLVFELSFRAGNLEWYGQMLARRESLIAQGKPVLRPLPVEALSWRPFLHPNGLANTLEVDGVAKVSRPATALVDSLRPSQCTAVIGDQRGQSHSSLHDILASWRSSTGECRKKNKSLILPPSLLTCLVFMDVLLPQLANPQRRYKTTARTSRQGSERWSTAMNILKKISIVLCKPLVAEVPHTPPPPAKALFYELIYHDVATASDQTEADIGKVEPSLANDHRLTTAASDKNHILRAFPHTIELLTSTIRAILDDEGGYIVSQLSDILAHNAEKLFRRPQFNKFQVILDSLIANPTSNVRQFFERGMRICISPAVVQGQMSTEGVLWGLTTNREPDRADDLGLRIPAINWVLCEAYEKAWTNERYFPLRAQLGSLIYLTLLHEFNYCIIARCFLPPTIDLEASATPNPVQNIGYESEFRILGGIIQVRWALATAVNNTYRFEHICDLWLQSAEFPDRTSPVRLISASALRAFHGAVLHRKILNIQTIRNLVAIRTTQEEVSRASVTRGKHLLLRGAPLKDGPRAADNRMHHCGNAAERMAGMGTSENVSRGWWRFPIPF
ncbi:hypothetical protein B0H16DRAFT_1817219 [Mycena metata]|uniref:Uncharacterized protein n=1 Tax=Mycena metata TaxID=1033252 RepID=A0AAD7NZ06_9AGAR|nr:hypothetical protein B0H16DRAFT_1817219 [Mycena metata]